MQHRTRRTVARSTAILVCLMFLGHLPAASAQTQAFQSVSGNAQYLDDGAECLEAIGWDGAPVPNGPTCVVLYGHIFDLLSDVYINVQGLPAKQPDLARGFTAYVTAEELGFDLNELELYSSPGFVEYASDDDIDPRIHSERGITADVLVSQTVPVVGYWYMSADAEEVSATGGDRTPVDAGAMPCLTVRMKIETGRVLGDGDVLAAGETTKTVITDGMTNEQVAAAQHDCSLMGGASSADLMMPNEVTEFRVDLGIPTADLPADKGFLVHVEWYQWAPDGGDRANKAAQREWNLHTGPENPNRVVMGLDNPLVVREVVPVFFDGMVHVRAFIDSPWGSYDVDPGSVELSVYGPDDQRLVDASILDTDARFRVDHGDHFEPMLARSGWDISADKPEPGRYRLEVSAKNWQHTGLATGTAYVEIEPDTGRIKTYDQQGQEQATADTPEEVEPAPMAPIGSLLVALGVAMAALRRRDGLKG